MKRRLSAGLIPRKSNFLGSKLALFAQTWQTASRHSHRYALLPVAWPRQRSSTLNTQKTTFAGYTILEVMIVLTISASLFVAVAVLLGGRQGNAETTQAVRDFEAHLQTMANDVANGYYPYSSGYKCIADNFGSQPTISIDATATSGQNLGCIYLGKVFNARKTAADILTIAGRQFTFAPGSADVTTLAQAMPIAIMQTNGANVTATYNYQYGLTVTSMTTISGVPTTLQAIGFIAELGSSGGNPLTGSRSTLLYGITGISPSLSDAQLMATTIKTSSTNLQLVSGGVRICLLGGNGKKAEIKIGESGSQTSTVVLIDNGVPSGEC